MRCVQCCLCAVFWSVVLCWNNYQFRIRRHSHRWSKQWANTSTASVVVRTTTRTLPYNFSQNFSPPLNGPLSLSCIPLPSSFLVHRFFGLWLFIVAPVFLFVVNASTVVCSVQVQMNCDIVCFVSIMMISRGICLRQRDDKRELPTYLFWNHITFQPSFSYWVHSSL